MPNARESPRYFFVSIPSGRSSELAREMEVRNGQYARVCVCVRAFLRILSRRNRASVGRSLILIFLSNLIRSRFLDFEFLRNFHTD